MKRIVIFCPYPLHQAPSQRFRFEQYLRPLEEAGFKITVLPFFNQRDWKLLSQDPSFLKTFIMLCRGFLNRILSIQQIFKANFVFVHREMFPIGPPVFEWITAKVFRKKMIYDFDDAIWLTDKTNETLPEKVIRWRHKVDDICRWSFKVSTGNEYLALYAKQFNESVLINPTTIDTENLHNRTINTLSGKILLLEKSEGSIKKKNSQLIIGWTGSHSTIKYLKALESVFQQLEAKFSHIKFLFIADRRPDFNLNQCNFLAWNKQTEIADLLQIDIGIMPLPDDPWTKGKCGFKALQYMALEIPCIASPVGVNSKMIEHGKNGFLCTERDEWLHYLELLITDKSLRQQIGKAGRLTVEGSYSVISNSSNFFSLFE